VARKRIVQCHVDGAGEGPGGPDNGWFCDLREIRLERALSCDRVGDWRVKPRIRGEEGVPDFHVSFTSRDNHLFCGWTLFASGRLDEEALEDVGHSECS
jgi:hypothetical protein